MKTRNYDRAVLFRVERHMKNYLITYSVGLQSFKAVEGDICFVIGEKPSRKHFEKNNRPTMYCQNVCLVFNFAETVYL